MPGRGFLFGKLSLVYLCSCVLVCLCACELVYVHVRLCRCARAFASLWDQLGLISKGNLMLSLECLFCPVCSGQYSLRSNGSRRLNLGRTPNLTTRKMPVTNPHPMVTSKAATSESIEKKPVERLFFFQGWCDF